MRLINTEALKYRRKDYDGYADVSDEERKEGILFLLKEDIDNAPTIDPVKHGKWMYKALGGWHCSVCDAQAPFWCFATTQNLSNYCPNCGARMDGE